MVEFRSRIRKPEIQHEMLTECFLRRIAPFPER